MTKPVETDGSSSLGLKVSYVVLGCTTTTMRVLELTRVAKGVGEARKLSQRPVAVQIVCSSYPKRKLLP